MTTKVFGRVVTLAVAAMLTTGGAWAADAPIITAARARDTAAVRQLIRSKSDVNAARPDGATALHWAAYWNDTTITELLLGAGANVNAATDLGITPLHMACRSGYPDTAIRLLAAGARPNTRALTVGETPLMAASRIGSLDIVKALLAAGAHPNEAETGHLQTALMWAVAGRHTEVVRALLEQGADVRARSSVTPVLFTRGIRGATQMDQIVPTEVPTGGFTPLLFAASRGNVESARLLLAAGADVNDATADGTSALTVAAHSGNSEVALLLIEQGADTSAARSGYTALHAAVLRGDPVVAKALLARGANPDTPLAHGTPVRRFSQDYAFVESLTGATPFWLAAKYAEAEIMSLLAGAGAATTVQLNGMTALLAAAGLGSRVDSRADRRDREMEGPARLTPEDDARLTRDAVAVALKLGADVRAADRNGDTALHAAAARGHDSVVELLVAAGASLDARNKEGLTPLMAAKDRPSTAALLQKLGALQ